MPAVAAARVGRMPVVSGVADVTRLALDWSVPRAADRLWGGARGGRGGICLSVRGVGEEGSVCLCAGWERRDLSVCVRDGRGGDRKSVV